MTSILGRVKDLISANVNSMLDGAEDPEKMANEYLRQLTNELYEARTNVASAMADETKLEQKMMEFQRDSDGWQSKAESALRAGDEVLAKAAIGRKVQSQKMADQYTSQHGAQDEQVNALQDALVQLETRIAETKAKKELIIAKKNRAQTQRAIQSTIQSIGRVNAMDKLDALEEKVDDQLNEAEAMSQLQQGSLETKFQQLEKDSEVDSELAELKRKLGMS